MRLSVSELLAATDSWIGTASELLSKLTTMVPDRDAHTRGWPSSGRILSNLLRRLAPNLRATGISVEFSRTHGGRRTVQICRMPTSCVTTVTGSHNSADALEATGDTVEVPCVTALASAPPFEALRHPGAPVAATGSADGDEGDAEERPSRTDGRGCGELVGLEAESRDA